MSSVEVAAEVAAEVETFELTKKIVVKVRGSTEEKRRALAEEAERSWDGAWERAEVTATTLGLEDDPDLACIDADADEEDETERDDQGDEDEDEHARDGLADDESADLDPLDRPF